jgi:hypothetical protein
VRPESSKGRPFRAVARAPTRSEGWDRGRAAEPMTRNEGILNVGCASFTASVVFQSRRLPDADVISDLAASAIAGGCCDREESSLGVRAARPLAGIDPGGRASRSRVALADQAFSCSSTGGDRVLSGVFVPRRSDGAGSTGEDRLRDQRCRRRSSLETRRSTPRRAGRSASATLAGTWNGGDGSRTRDDLVRPDSCKGAPTCGSDRRGRGRAAPLEAEAQRRRLDNVIFGSSLANTWPATSPRSTSQSSICAPIRYSAR